MVEGIGWLMDLCPQPEVLTLAGWCKEFGVLPSQVKNTEDWQLLADYASLTNLSRNWDAWHRMVEKPELGISLPQDLIQYMLGLMDEARERYG